MGQLKLLELRAKAQQALGDNSISAPSMTKYLIPALCPSIPWSNAIDSWIAQQKAQK